MCVGRLTVWFEMNKTLEMGPELEGNIFLYGSFVYI